MANPNPIRVAIVGLSTSPSGVSWSNIAHLPYLRKSPYFKITALLNSTVESAQRSIKEFDLPSDAKAYSDPEDLANDPNVDLVVVSVRVDKHAQVSLPSLKKGKDVFVEWPMDKNAEVAKSMIDALKEGGGVGIVGLQGRQSPIIRAVKQAIDQGRIGRVLNSTVTAAATNGGATEGTNLEYALDRRVGGHLGTIHYGHVTDYIFTVLGEPKSVSTMLSSQRPTANVIDKEGKVLRSVPRTAPDTLFLHAELQSGALLSFALRGGPAFPGTPAFNWRIYGEKGEIEVIGEGIFYNVGVKSTVRLHNAETGDVEEISIAENEKQFNEGLGLPAQNIGRVYEGYAELKSVKPAGDSGYKERLVTFEDAYKRHVFIDEGFKRWDAGQQGLAV